MEKYDIVIIGSGLGGLFTGAMLAKTGKKVCVLEKNKVAGGNLQVFKRKGCAFSVGMHYAGSLGEGEVLNKIFKYLGIFDNMKIDKLDEDSFERIHIKDKSYSFPMGLDNFEKRLISYFPEEKEAIKKYVLKLKNVWNSNDFLNLRVFDPTNYNLNAYGESAFQYIKELTANEELQNLLASTNPLYFGNREKTSMFVHGTINYFFLQSAWRIAEEGENLADLMREIIERKGGKLLLKKEVNRLNFNGMKVDSVSTTNGESYFADDFISNIHPAPLMDMIEPGKLRKAFVNRIKGLENTASSFTLYVVLKKRQFKHEKVNHYYYNTHDVWDYEYTQESWPKGYMMYTTEDKNNKGYAESMEIITMMKFDDVRKWEETTLHRRGAEYNNFKKERTEKLLEVVYKKFPELKESIDYIEAATPLTYRDYTNTPEGSIYGIIKDYNDPAKSILSSKTRVPNLFLTGQNNHLHGILGVVMSGLQTCASFMDIKELFDQIKKF
jgi:all-trans-retinol 13,14-reductase